VKRTKDEWKAYFKKAEGREVRVLIERGRDIREFHDDYLENPAEYSNRWDDACKTYVGLSKGPCSYYEAIARVFGKMDEEGALQPLMPHLPVDVQSLYNLGKAFEAHPETVDILIKDGTVNPEMSRDEAVEVFHQAEEERDRPEPEPEPDEIPTWELYSVILKQAKISMDALVEHVKTTEHMTIEDYLMTIKSAKEFQIMAIEIRLNAMRMYGQFVFDHEHGDPDNVEDLFKQWESDGDDPEILREGMRFAEISKEDWPAMRRSIAEQQYQDDEKADTADDEEDQQEEGQD
jgi:hypothetical protein